VTEFKTRGLRSITLNATIVGRMTDDRTQGEFRR
jgi:hypothetical protein